MQGAAARQNVFVICFVDEHAGVSILEQCTALKSSYQVCVNHDSVKSFQFCFCAALRLELFARNRLKVANLNRRDAGMAMAPQQYSLRCALSDWTSFAVEDASFGLQAAPPKAQRHVSLHLKKNAGARS